MITLNVRYTLDAPEGIISPTGMREIITYMNSQKLTEGEWLALNPEAPRAFMPPLPFEWEWVWLTKTGEFKGRFPARVSNYLFKTYGLRCPASFLTEVGNIARRHTEDNPVYTFEFVNDFRNWHEGEFGDMGSCYYWERNEEVWGALANNGAWAVRFYNSADNGMARAWFVPLPNNLYVLFNGYGFAGNATLVVARVVATWLGVDYRKIYLSNNGHTGGLVWIDDGIGYVIGQAEYIAAFASYDLRWNVYETTCEGCGTWLYDDNSYYGADDYTYCEHCYYARFDRCERCGETVEREEITETLEGRYICQYCLERHYNECATCEGYTAHAIQIGDTLYCEGCAEKQTPPESE